MKRIICFLFIMFFAGEAYAQLPPVPSTGRSLGLGDGMTATAVAVDAIRHNPAGLAAARMYALNTSYSFREHAGGDARHVFTANVSDMKSNQFFGAGLSMYYEFGAQRLFDGRLAVGVPIWEEHIQIGMGFNYSYYKKHKEMGSKHLFDVSVGLMLRPFEWLSFGFAAFDLIVQNNEKDYGARKLSAGAALRFASIGLMMSADVCYYLRNEKTELWEASFGAEYMLYRKVPLRFGGGFSKYIGHISAGLGYKEERFGADIGYRHDFTRKNKEVNRDGNYLALSVEAYF